MNNTIFPIIIRYMLVLFFEKERIGNVRPVSPEIAYNAIVGLRKKSN